MSKRRAKPIQLAPWANTIVGNIDWTSLGDDPMGDMQIFAGATSQEALGQRLRGEVEAEVAAMLDAIKEFDAFDVIELIRLRELPVVPVAALVDGHDGSGAAIDLVSLVCLSRPSRMPSGKDRQSTEPHHAISDLHARATRLLRLGNFMHAASSALAADDPLARLASEYQSYLVGVRKFQYDSVQAEHDGALFDRPEIGALLQEHLGFTFCDCPVSTNFPSCQLIVLDRCQPPLNFPRFTAYRSPTSTFMQSGSLHGALARLRAEQSSLSRAAT